MELNNQAANELALLLISCFPPLHCASKEVSTYLRRVFNELSLQKEQLRALTKALDKRAAESTSTLFLGSADIARKDIADLLPDIDYSSYIKDLNKTADSMSVLQEINVFVNKFNSKYGRNDVSEGKSDEFRAFVHQIVSKLQHIWPNKSSYVLNECVESHVSTLIHDKHFPAMEEQDDAFCKRVSVFDFIGLSHLEIPTHYKEVINWQYAEEALLKMDHKKTPRDKVKSIFECFKIIAEEISRAHKGPVGADDLVPCVIYALLKANPLHIHSNLQYISMYRSPDQMLSESGYFHVSLYAAVSFVENLDAKQLAINPEIYASAVNKANQEQIPVIPKFGDLLCEKCKGMGGWGTFGACSRSSPDYLGFCPACKGSGYFPGGTLCIQCTGKGGLGVLGICEVYDAFFVEYCPSCKGLCFIRELHNSEGVSSLESMHASTQEIAENDVFQGVDKPKIFISLISLALVEGKSYDARVRCALQRMARQMAVPMALQLEMEQGVIQTLSKASSAQHSSSPSTASTSSSFRSLKIVAAAAAGGAALALTGGLAAPLVGHLFGVMGLSTIISAMTTTTGVGGGALLSFLCGSVGATVTAEKMVRKTAGLEQFEFTRVLSSSHAGSPDQIHVEGAVIKNHNYVAPAGSKAVETAMVELGGQEYMGLHVVVGVPGWESEDKECVCAIWAKALHDISGGFGDHFVLAWEGQYLKKLGNVLKSYKGAQSMSQSSIAGLVASKMLYHSLLSSTVIHEASVVDSPWSIVRDRAEKAGKLLAHELLEVRLGARPVTLVGISMGARLVFHCLEELAKIKNSKILSAGYERDPSSVIENIVLIGAAVPADMLRWAEVRSMVAGRMINCYNPDDYILDVIYKTVHWFADGVYSPAGVAPVSSHPQHTYLTIENINLCGQVDNHMDYQTDTTLKYILELCGIYPIITAT